MDLAVETRRPSEARADVLVLGRYGDGGRLPAEMELAESLVHEKYGTERWTRAGRSITAQTVAIR